MIIKYESKQKKRFKFLMCDSIEYSRKANFSIIIKTTPLKTENNILYICEYANGMIGDGDGDGECVREREIEKI